MWSLRKVASSRSLWCSEGDIVVAKVLLLQLLAGDMRKRVCRIGVPLSIVGLIEREDATLTHRNRFRLVDAFIITMIKPPISERKKRGY